MVLSPIRSIRKKEDTILNSIIFILKQEPTIPKWLSYEYFLCMINVSRNSWCFNNCYACLSPISNNNLQTLLSQSFFNHQVWFSPWVWTPPKNQSRSISHGYKKYFSHKQPKVSILFHMFDEERIIPVTYLLICPFYARRREVIIHQCFYILFPILSSFQ